jgi:hypothetical protein
MNSSVFLSNFENNGTTFTDGVPRRSLPGPGIGSGILRNLLARSVVRFYPRRIKASHRDVLCELKLFRSYLEGSK